MNYSLAQAAQLALHAFELEDDLPESTLCYEMRLAQRQMQRKEHRLLAMTALQNALAIEVGEDTSLGEMQVDHVGSVVQMQHAPKVFSAPVSVVPATPLAPIPVPVTSLRPNASADLTRMAEAFKQESIGSVQLKMPRA